jgi:hypothetical protein
MRVTMTIHTSTEFCVPISKDAGNLKSCHHADDPDNRRQMRKCVRVPVRHDGRRSRLEKRMKVHLTADRHPNKSRTFFDNETPEHHNLKVSVRSLR